MLNPYIQDGHPDKQRAHAADQEAYSAESQGRTGSASSSRDSVGLWVGKLLIRMGRKLTREDVLLRSTREHA